MHELAETQWVLGVWSKDGSTEKSHKVKLEPKPKGWAYIPRKKIGETKVVSGELGKGQYLWWCVYEVAVDWLDMAKIPEYLRFDTEDATRKTFVDETHPMVISWRTEGKDHGAAKPKQANLYMPPRDPEF